MNFCENCHIVSDAERCPVCGSKRLRPVEEDDFCLLTENTAEYGSMLTDIFDEENIPYSAVPYGSGLETKLGLPFKNSRLFVPYGSLEAAREIIKQLDRSATEELREDLLANVENLNVSGRLEKKARKRIKLSQDEDFFEVCIGLIESAEKIADRGIITNCLKRGHYLFVFSGNTTLVINSETYEILSLTKDKQ
ncbi:MAG: hypothetical protein K2K04_01995 [Clostridia bacterium]|nr:hypothetical protein [Clostridia bacterium]